MIEFRARLLALMPDEPLTAKIVALRQHMVDAVASKNSAVATPAGITKLLTDRAKAIAMPPGDPVGAQGALVPFVGGKFAPNGTRDDKKGKDRKGGDKDKQYGDRKAVGSDRKVVHA